MDYHILLAFLCLFSEVVNSHVDIMRLSDSIFCTLLSIRANATISPLEIQIYYSAAPATVPPQTKYTPL